MSASSSSSIEERVFSAIRQGKVRRLNKCLDACDSLEVTDSDNRTPLVHAVCCGTEDSRTHIVRMLIRQKCNVNAKDIYGRTALMYACMERDKIDIVRLISRTKMCNPNLQDHEGYTALMHAVAYGNVASIRVLVNSSHTKFISDLSLKNLQGLDALELSMKLQLPECCQILVSEGKCDTSEIKDRRMLLSLLGKNVHYSHRPRTPFNSKTLRTLPLSPLNPQADERREFAYIDRSCGNVSRLSIRQPSFTKIIEVDVESSYKGLRRTPEPVYRSNSLYRSNSNLFSLDARMPSNLQSSQTLRVQIEHSPKTLKRALTPISRENSRTLSVSPQSQSIGYQRSRLPSIPSGKRLFLAGSQRKRQPSDL